MKSKGFLSKNGKKLKKKKVFEPKIGQKQPKKKREREMRKKAEI